MEYYSLHPWKNESSEKKYVAFTIFLQSNSLMAVKCQDSLCLALQIQSTISYFTIVILQRRDSF